MLLIPYRWFLMASFLGTIWWSVLCLVVGFGLGWWLCVKRGGKI